MRLLRAQFTIGRLMVMVVAKAVLLAWLADNINWD
jgi:hypothetical protein